MSDNNTGNNNDRLSGKDSQAEQVTSYVTMKIVAFLNARHYMVFADNKGKTHGHSWQLQAEARVPVKYDSFIKFEDLDKLLNKLLAPYQRNVLNDVFPFDIIEPLTENISVYFFNSLADALENLDVDLVRLTVWENPTRGIEITERLPQYFSSHENQSVPAVMVQEALKQAAMSSDNEAPTSDIQPDSGLIVGPINSEKGAGKAEGTASASNNPIGEPDGTKCGLVQREESLCAGQPQGLLTSLRLRLKSQNISIGEEAKRPNYPLGKIIIAIMVISGVAIWVYWPLLNAPLYKIYPWGSDTWGHLFKAEFLYREIMNGNYYPQFMPDWYNGCQPFRYWAPLPYYLIALLNHFTQNIFAAGNYYIFVCALLGGLGCLLLARRIGLWPAVMLGIIWLIWPDNVQIALSEGNLPRILATGFLPLLFYAFLETVEDKNKIWLFLVTLTTIHIVILCHAMIGAVYTICLLIFGLLWWVFGGCSFTDFIRGMGAIFIGILSSAWWLLPSLRGGLTAMGETAAGGIQYVSPNISFNPMIRFSNKEEFYWGIALLVITLISVTLWRKKPAWAKSLIITGLFLVLLTFPAFSWLHQLLPLSHILWPLRFSTFASFALLAASFAISIPYLRNIEQIKKKWVGLLTISLFVLLLFDSIFSLNVLIETRVAPYRVVQSAGEIKKSEGWKVATLDLSSLGSAPSYLLSVESGREQVFGWAWQGASTARNIMLLNTAIQKRYYPFLFRQLTFLGATDLVIRDSMVKDLDKFKKVAYREGFRQQETIEGISYWRKTQMPYLITTDRKCLAIGKYAENYALQFPSVEIGYSNTIDDYNMEYLNKYPLLILSGAQWKQQKEAERRVLQYVESGGKVIVDMTGFPTDTMSREPKFLGVYSEHIEIKGGITINSSDGDTYLGSFSNGNDPWKSLIPQPLDGVELSFNYMGNQAPVYGYKYYEGKKIWFLGANLAYYSFLTREPAARQILQEIVQLPQDQVQVNIIPLKSYQSNNQGYNMSYQNDQALDAIIPIAALDGMEARIDGERVALDKYENLVRIHLPAGTHSIDLRIGPSPVYSWGRSISCLGLGLIFLYCIRMKFDIRRLRNTPEATRINGINSSSNN